MSVRPVRVAILLSDGMASRGGIGRVIGYLLRDIPLLTSDIETLPLSARWSVLPVLKHLTVPLAVFVFVVVLIGRQIDVVHINLAPRGSTWRKMIFAGASRILGRPVLLHLHGSAYDEYFDSLTPSRQAHVRRFFQRSTRVIALDENWKHFIVSRLDVPADHVVVIPNGVPLAQALAPKVSGANPLIVTFGLLGRRKGTDVLLDALAHLSARGIPWRAVIGGDGEVGEAKERAAALGISDRIEFPGWVSEDVVDRRLREADLFVLPSRGENQPVAILEAMARGTPVVATRVGAIPKQVEDGVTGLLVSPDEVGELADALQALIEDPERRAALGAAGLKRFEAKFSARICAERFVELYREVTR